jgi:hypothetical protein
MGEFESASPARNPEKYHRSGVSRYKYLVPRNEKVISSFLLSQYAINIPPSHLVMSSTALHAIAIITPTPGKEDRVRM